MSPVDLRDAVSWMSARWGYEKAWSDWESLAADFEPYTVGALKEALNAWYRRGESRQPKPSQLLKAVSETQLRRIERGVDEFDRGCAGNHVWADPTPTDTDRHQTCVLCGATGGNVACDHVYNKTSGRCVYCLEGAA